MVGAVVNAVDMVGAVVGAGDSVGADVKVRNMKTSREVITATKKQQHEISTKIQSSTSTCFRLF